MPGNYCFREALHLFELRTELQQHEVKARGFKLRQALGNLFRRADQTRP